LTDGLSNALMIIHLAGRIAHGSKRSQPVDEAIIEHGMCLVVRAAFASNDSVVLHGDTVVV
jgi:hypothetical protein